MLEPDIAIVPLVPEAVVDRVTVPPFKLCEPLNVMVPLLVAEAVRLMPLLADMVPLPDTLIVDAVLENAPDVVMVPALIMLVAEPLMLPVPWIVAELELTLTVPDALASVVVLEVSF